MAGVDEVRLAAGGEAAVHLLEDGGAVLGGGDPGGDGLAARGEFVDGAHVEFAVQRHRERARDGRGRHEEGVGAGVALRQRHPLANAEAVLFVDHDESERAELDPLLDERVRAHDEVGLAARDPRPRLLAAAPRGRPHQDLQRAGQVAEEVADPPGVLLGEDLGRRHQRGLAPALDGQEHGEERDQGLSGADVSLEHAVHAAGGGHVGVDLAEDAGLRPGEAKGERRVERADEAVGAGVHDAGALAGGVVADARVEELQEEELVECEAAAGGLDVGQRAGAVEVAERGGELDEAERATIAGGEVLLRADLAEQPVEVEVEEAAEDPLGDVFGGGVGGEDGAGGVVRGEGWVAGWGVGGGGRWRRRSGTRATGACTRAAGSGVREKSAPGR